MAQWIEVGGKLLNIDQIELVEQINSSLIRIYLQSGQIVELTDNLATNVWNLLIIDRVPFLDSDNPMRQFSGT